MKMLNKDTNELDSYIQRGKVVLVVGLIWLVATSAGYASASVTGYMQQVPDTIKKFVLNEKVAKSQRRVSLKLDNVSLSSALQVLAKKARVGLSLQAQVISSKKVTIDVNETSVYEVLDILLKGTGLEAVLPSSRDVLVIRQKLSQDFKMQLETVQGTVTDAQSGETLPGVNILVKGTNSGTSTDIDGNFSLEVSSLQDTLIFSFVGYQTRRIPIKGRNRLDITLQQRAISGKEMVVIGYGSKKKEDVTGAVSSISSKDIETSTSMTPQLAMQGKLTGVSVQSAGGNPSARPKIRIRGITTFGDSNPLYVIDGVSIEEGGSGINTADEKNLRTNVNIFSLVDPSNIASISVLKGASASAIYGVRGANGVILITTKQGEQGGPVVSVDASTGFQNTPETYNYLTTQQYAKLYQEAYANNPQVDPDTKQPVSIGQSSAFGPGYDPNSSQYLGNRPTTNWQDAILNQEAPINNVHARISGANDKTNYYFSMGRTYTAGGIIGNNQERYNVVANINSEVNKVIKAGLNVHLSTLQTLQNTPGNLNLFSAPPWQPIYGDGPYGYAPATKGSFEPNPDYDPSKLNAGPPQIFTEGSPSKLWGQETVSNGIASHNFGYTKLNNNSVIGKAYLQVEPIQGLQIKGMVDGNLYNVERSNWSDNLNYQKWVFSATPNNPYVNTDGNSAGFYGKLRGDTKNIEGQLSVKYIHNFGKHNINILFNNSRQHYTWVTFGGGSSEVLSARPNLRYFKNKTRYTNSSVEQRQNYALIGFLGRISYNYGSTYYLVLTARRDGSSRFAPGHRWGTFPSFSAGWRITNEDFMKGVTWLNDLKIRGGYGALGNEQTTIGFAYLSTVSRVPHYAFGSGGSPGYGVQQIGAYLPNFPNRDLSWEKVYSGSVGFDAEMFDNRVSLSADWYHKKTAGIIQSVGLAPNAGIENPIDLNVANVVNRGFEIQAGYQQTFDNRLGFSFSGNLTTVHNEVTKLYNGIPDRSAGLEVGRPIGFLYGYKMGGIFQNQEQINKWEKAHTDKVGTGNPQPGDIYFKDLNSPPTGDQPSYAKTAAPDSVVNSLDRTYLGSTIPKLYYGFNLGLNYRNFDFSLFFQGTGKHMRTNSAKQLGESMGGTGNNQFTSVLNRWTPDNHSTTMPRGVYNDPNKNARYSDRWVENAAYLRLQNVELGYTFPKTWLHKSGFMRYLRIYVRGINLFTATSWSGIDPEASGFYYPSTRQFELGISARF